jgi:hypothetical protein
MGSRSREESEEMPPKSVVWNEEISSDSDTNCEWLQQVVMGAGYSVEKLCSASERYNHLQEPYGVKNITEYHEDVTELVQKIRLMNADPVSDEVINKFDENLHLEEQCDCLGPVLLVTEDSFGFKSWQVADGFWCVFAETTHWNKKNQSKE